jgi:hypothetical protein
VGSAWEDLSLAPRVMRWCAEFYVLTFERMNQIKRIFKKTVKLFASLKLAVVIIVALAVLISVGTFVEARYNAEIALKLVYDTWMMKVVMSSLAFTLIAVMIDRWPWQKRHVPFILAHIGILVIQVGFVVSGMYGIDGTMRFGFGESNRFVTLPSTELQIWSSFDGERFTKLFDKPVDFFLKPPSEEKISINLPDGKIEIKDYAPFINPNRRIYISEQKQRGAALRFLVKNDRVNVSEWLFQKRPDQLASHNMGPAQFFLGPLPVKKLSELPAENAIYFQTIDDKTVSYVLTYKDTTKKPLQGKLREGESFQTGWMGLEFKVLRYFQHAEENLEIKKLEYPTPMSTAAIFVEFSAGETQQQQWVQLNDVFKFFSKDAVYIITYGNRRVDLGFALLLKEFEVGRNPGSMRAASYQSLVMTPEGEDVLISMNQPLQYQGLTFYQASFQDGPDGQPIASILSVNHDPGRWLKYLGSLILSLGVIWLFYHKRKAARAQAPATGKV